MKYNYKKIMLYKSIFAVIMIIIGIILEVTTNSKSDFFGFHSVGGYLITIGVIFFIVIGLYAAFFKERKIDERMMLHAYKSGRITYAILILVAFSIMIIDGINPITISYRTMMAYFIVGSTIVLMISFWFMTKNN
jgi:hypothetical protein